MLRGPAVISVTLTFLRSVCGDFGPLSSPDYIWYLLVPIFSGIANASQGAARIGGAAPCAGFAVLTPARSGGWLPPGAMSLSLLSLSIDVAL